MYFSTIFTLLSVTAITSATAIEKRNANHVSMYTTPECNNNDKYYKWKSTSTCSCIVVDKKAASIYTDHEPLQKAIAFSDGDCKTPLGAISAKSCLRTADTFNGTISSVMFWLDGVCDGKLKDIAQDIKQLFELGAAVADVVEH